MIDGGLRGLASSHIRHAADQVKRLDTLVDLGARFRGDSDMVQPLQHHMRSALSLIQKLEPGFDKKFISGALAIPRGSIGPKRIALLANKVDMLRALHTVVDGNRSHSVYRGLNTEEAVQKALAQAYSVESKASSVTQEPYLDAKSVMSESQSSALGTLSTGGNWYYKSAAGRED